jgi:class 3 adenylate cyclase
LATLSKPEVRYAKSGEVHIAYQVFGKGSVNMVASPGSISHLDYYWEEPGMRRYLDALGRFARVAIFDKRGTGLSDREAGIPTFEERMDDIRAVMDAAKFEDAVILGVSEGVPMSILFAASYPSRTRRLILIGGEAKGTWSPDYPWENTEEEWEESLRRTERDWGTTEWKERAVSSLAPSRIGDTAFTKWLSDMRRMGGSPGASIALSKSEMMMDVRSVLPAVHVPTLVIHVTGDRACDIGEGRYLAKHIPGARMIELPGVDHMFFVDRELTDRVTKEIERFTTDEEPTEHSDRILSTVLFTDIVDSTKKAAELGDARWESLLEQHNSLVRGEIRRFKGEEIKSTGDGFLAIFDGPTRAVRCAWAIAKSVKGLGISVRAGVHTGECMIGSSDISGIAVHVGSRILAVAGAGEVIVSGTVKDLVYGSGISFRDIGEHQLKGIEEKRQLFAVSNVA